MPSPPCRWSSTLPASSASCCCCCCCSARRGDRVCPSWGCRQERRSLSRHHRRWTAALEPSPRRCGRWRPGSCSIASAACRWYCCCCRCCCCRWPFHSRRHRCSLRSISASAPRGCCCSVAYGWSPCCGTRSRRCCCWRRRCCCQCRMAAVSGPRHPQGRLSLSGWMSCKSTRKSIINRACTGGGGGGGSYACWVMYVNACFGSITAGIAIYGA